MMQFAGLRGVLDKSNERNIAESLNRIEGHLSTLAGQSARVSAFVDVTQFGDQYVKKVKGDL
jgi:hypothetical protein